LARNLATPFLGRKPKARVATKVLSQMTQFFHFVLEKMGTNKIKSTNDITLEKDFLPINYFFIQLNF
jgi:hypothetical protein